MPGRMVELGSYHAMLSFVLATFPECDWLQIHEFPRKDRILNNCLIWHKGCAKPEHGGAGENTLGV